MNKNIVKIVSSSLILQIAIAISGFILPKFFIETYGSEVNGLINSIKQFLTYFSTVTLGLASASSVALYKPLYKKNERKINGILAATRIFFNKTGFLFLIFVLVLAITYPFIISSSLKSINIFLIILILGIGSFCEYILVTKYRVLLISDQKNYVVSRITTEGVVINLAVSLILIINNVNYILVQIVATFIYVFRLLSTKKYVHNNYSYVDYYVEPDFEAIEGRWDAFFYEIPRLIINYSPIIFISVFINLTWVSIYSVYNMVFSSLFMIVSVFTTGINAVFGNLLAKDSESISEKFDSFVFIFNVINLVLYSSSIVLIIPFINIYINSNVNYVYPLVAIGFTLSGFLRSSRLPYNVIIEASGKFKENKVPNIIEAVVFLILSVISIHVYGVVGILFSSAITGFIRNIFYIIFVSKNIIHRLPTKSMLMYLYNCLQLVGIPFIITRFVKFQSVSVISWIYKAVIVVSLSLAFILLLQAPFNSRHYKQLTKRIVNRFGRK
ncbi:hypothetical protein EY693_04485 [Enterococcus casseliflavus]|uniref:lipopolysaccharide biosynthesis protein n=1 Tax=Enterococcus casseliflavus TaxID=37734 RepID=UPI001AD73412|nr:hypothetical protein [Enterococcus casseliflavus]MBO6357952.1 hypothetical protein [Enterococcus casseliflavus]MBO6375598.1 hypothetical protein [Enterococcus casseliflavus]